MILIFLLCWNISNADAFDFETDKWVDFEGKLGNMDIQLSLFHLKNGEITGNYCYKKYEIKIKLKGRVKGDQIELNEIVNGKLKGSFKGTFFEKEDKFEGIWTKENKKYNFYLSISSIVGMGEVEHRYSFFDGTDNDVEEFMKMVKISILNNDKIWISKHINYPLKTNLSNQKSIIIKNQKQMILYFEQVFHKSFKKEISTFCCCNLFIKYSGVMLGNGQIWINPGNPNPNKDKYQYSITSINNINIL